MTDLCTVSGSIKTLGLSPLAGATVTFTPAADGLNRADGDVIVPTPVTATTGEGGAFLIDVLPGVYAVTVADPGGWTRHDPVAVAVPEAATANLADIMAAPLPPTVDAAEQAVFDAQAARDEATAAAQDADTAKDAASASASAAAISAGSAQADKQTATQKAAEAAQSATSAAQSASAASSIVGGLGSLTQAVTDAQTARTGAETARTGAETARDAAITAGAAVGTFASTTAGISGTTSGQRFWAPSGEFLQLYTNTAGAAVAVANAILPLKSYFDTRFGETPDPWAVESADGFIIMRAASDATIRMNWPVRLGSSQLSETSGQLRLGSLYTADAPAVTGLQFVTDDGFVLFTSASLLNTISME